MVETLLWSSAGNIKKFVPRRVEFVSYTILLTALVFDMVAHARTGIKLYRVLLIGRGQPGKNTRRLTS